MQRRLWTQEEDHIILELVNRHGHKKWTLIADQMQKVCPIHFRTSKQIRQRWHNHLDPNVNKEPWSVEEEKLLFDAHSRFGSKWKDIAAQLNKRTDNYVKNHFYSTLRRSLRRINKYLGSKNSTNQMRTIRPSILSYLLQLSETDSEYRILVGRIFEFANFKPSKNSQTNIIDDLEKDKFQSAIQKLIQLNESYTQHRNRKKAKQTIKTGKVVSIQQKQKPLTEIEEKLELSTEKNVIGVEMCSKEEGIQGSVGSWHDESPINHHGKLPDLIDPQCQYELLCDKEMEEDDRIEEKTLQNINFFK